MKYTIEQLENIACDMGRNHCYGGSTAFQKALAFVKSHNIETYKALLLQEIQEMGLEDILEDEFLSDEE